MQTQDFTNEIFNENKRSIFILLRRNAFVGLSQPVFLALFFNFINAST